jgi:hypothetical protein
MLSREQAEAAVFKSRALVEDGWTRTVEIVELVQMPLAEAAPETLGLFDFLLFETLCWRCTYTTTDSFADGKVDGPCRAICIIAQPVAEPVVLV